MNFKSLKKQAHYAAHIFAYSLFVWTWSTMFCGQSSEDKGFLLSPLNQVVKSKADMIIVRTYDVTTSGHLQ